jgi:uncharacterized protein (DUF2237 family)
MTAEFLEHQRAWATTWSRLGPSGVPGLVPGDRWCVVAVRWLQAYRDGRPLPSSSPPANARWRSCPLEVLAEYSVDVPADVSTLDDGPSAI